MKKILNVFLLLIAIVCMSACEKNVENNEINIDNTNSEEILEVKRYFDSEKFNEYSDLQVINMPENPTTGYGWVYIVGDSSVVNVKRDEFVSNANEEGLVGVGGTRVMEIVGISEGNTTIKCEYMRNWEENAIETVTYYVAVNGENEIAIIDEVHE